MIQDTNIIQYIQIKYNLYKQKKYPKIKCNLYIQKKYKNKIQFIYTKERILI